MLILSGRVSIKMAPVIRRIYDQMLEPKWVISMGACASSAGMFNNYALVAGADKFLPIDVYVPGCPPRPEALIYGIMKLQDKITRDPGAGMARAVRVRRDRGGVRRSPGSVQASPEGEHLLRTRGWKPRGGFKGDRRKPEALKTRGWKPRGANPWMPPGSSS